MTDLTGYTEEEILEGCMRNERKYQEILYRKYAPLMYTVCLGYAGNRSAAQDVLQDGFVKVFQNIGKFNKDKPNSTLEGWIRRILVNTAIDLHRKKARLNNLISENEPLENAHSKDHDVFEKLGMEDIVKQLNRLPDGARLIFNMHALEGYPHKEIAAKLNISEGTSKSQFSRARELLQKMLHDPANVNGKDAK